MTNAILETQSENAGAAAIGGYDDLIVHLEGAMEDESRVAHAEALAKATGAHLVGLFTNVVPEPVRYASEVGAAAIVALQEAIHQEGEDIRRRLSDRFARLGVANELRVVEGFSHAIARAAAREARAADVFVATLPREDASRWESLIEAVIFEGGRSVYLVPPGTRPRSHLRTVMIAWSDTREAARSIAEALPMLRSASRVMLVHVQDHVAGRMGGAEAMVDVAAHLARQGVDAQVAAIEHRSSVAQDLLAEAHRVSADVIVAGAYGHSRYREWIIGGATRDLMALSDLPILMAH